MRCSDSCKLFIAFCIRKAVESGTILPNVAQHNVALVMFAYKWPAETVTWIYFAHLTMFVTKAGIEWSSRDFETGLTAWALRSARTGRNKLAAAWHWQCSPGMSRRVFFLCVCVCVCMCVCICAWHFSKAPHSTRNRDMSWRHTQSGLLPRQNFHAWSSSGYKYQVMDSFSHRAFKDSN